MNHKPRTLESLGTRLLVRMFAEGKFQDGGRWESFAATAQRA